MPVMISELMGGTADDRQYTMASHEGLPGAEDKLGQDIPVTLRGVAVFLVLILRQDSCGISGSFIFQGFSVPR